MHNDKIRRIGNTILPTAAAIVALLLAMACSGEEQIFDLEPDQNQALYETDGEHRIASEQVEATVLAEITTADGAAYTFLETPSGDVALEVAALGPVDAPHLPGQNTNLVELYQSLSGQPAPEALVLAEKRADAKSRYDQRSTEDQDQAPWFSAGDLPGDGLPPETGTGILALTAQEFKAMYCPENYDFLYCWPDTGGNPWVQRTGTYFCGAMAATNCTTFARYRYRENGVWKTYRYVRASPGEHYRYCMSGSKLSRRWEILNNSQNCGVRFSAWGKN